MKLFEVDGDVPKWLRGRSAKSLRAGSNPAVASAIKMPKWRNWQTQGT